MTDHVRTAPQATAPSVLVVGCTAALVDNVKKALAGDILGVYAAQLQDLTNQVAMRRPWMIVTVDAVYEFDAVGFEHLARDVGARLVRLSDDDAAYTEVRHAIHAALIVVRKKRGF